MKFKKLTASILATMMAVSLVACGNTNEQSGAASGSSEKKEESSAAADASSAEESTEEESTGITFPLEEPMTFTMFNLMNGETSLTEVDAWHYVEDRTNVHFEQTEVTTAELSEKMSLILASGDITDKCEHPEVMIAWADWFYTPEGTILAMQGVENVNWKYDEEGYRIGITPEISAYLGGTSYMPCNTDLEYTSKLASAKNPDTRHYVMGGIQAADKYGVKKPTLEFSEDASERYSDLNANIIPYVENYMAKVVTGETALEDSWAEFQSKLEAMGAAEYLDLMVGAMGDGYVAAE